MAKRTNSRNKNTTRASKQNVKKTTENLPELAKQVLSGNGKNPYYFGGTVIKNYDELHVHIDEFKDHEAIWLADWIDYLGDNSTAQKIRETPNEFKNIVTNRISELKKYKDE